MGLTLPDVAAATKCDGSPMLKPGGYVMAGLANNPSAEPDTLVVRMSSDDRELLTANAPDTYYVTDYYRKHPVVLVRFARVETPFATSSRCRGG